MKPRVNRSLRRLLYHIAKANAELNGKPFSSQQQVAEIKQQDQGPSVEDFTTLLSAVKSLKQDVSTLLKEQSFHDSYDKQIVHATQQEHERLNELGKKEQKLESEYQDHDRMLQTAAERLETLSSQVRNLQNSAVKEERKQTEQKTQTRKPDQTTTTAHNEVSMEHMHRLKEIMYVEDKLQELERYYLDMKESGETSERLNFIQQRIGRFKNKIKELKEKNKIFQ